MTRNDVFSEAVDQAGDTNTTLLSTLLRFLYIGLPDTLKSPITRDNLKRVHSMIIEPRLAEFAYRIPAREQPGQRCFRRSSFSNFSRLTPPLPNTYASIA